MPIDYQKMQRIHPTQKSRLTRAKKLEDAGKRYQAVLAACVKAVGEWDDIGAWPDDWSNWQRALDDAAFEAYRAQKLPSLRAPRLDELV